MKKGFKGGYKYFTPENKKEYDAMGDDNLIRVLVSKSKDISEQKDAMKGDEDLKNLQAEVKRVKGQYTKLIDEDREHMDYVIRLLNAKKNGKEMPTA